MTEALVYSRLENLEVSCRLCAHGCRIKPGQFGICQVRQNIGGRLYTHNYAKLVAANIDPVEKKPLYHFLPGSSTFSVAAPGCNFSCGFCQNWEISQLDPLQGKIPGREFSPAQVVQSAKNSACASIAYTYTEPTIYFEFALQTCRLARQEGLRNVFVTNGYMSHEAVSLISPYLDGANIDLKFFKDSTYQKVCGAKLNPVLDAIQWLAAAGTWVELTTLIIPGLNDDPQELTGIARFIASVNRDIPWHISRFHADYKFSNYPATPEDTLKLAYDIGLAEGLRYVYVGNFQAWGQDTCCSGCGKVLVRRKGLNILEAHLKQGRCAFCRLPLAGIF